MKTLSIFMVGAFGTCAFIDLFNGHYYVSLLEFIIAVYNLIHFKEAK
jgi:hypothetical protein